MESEVSLLKKVVKEVPVVDTELMEKLKIENEKLKVGNFLSSIIIFSCFTFYGGVQKIKAIFGILFLFHMQTLVTSLEQKIDETEEEI